MKKTAWFILAWLCLLLVSGSGAQPEYEALTGPLILTVNAEQDALILIEAESGKARRLSVGDGQHTAWGFSPDGCRVLLTLTDGAGIPKAYTTDLRGQDLQALVRYDELAESAWGIWEPTWSPDGSRIAFTMLRDGFEGAPERQSHVGYVTQAGEAPTFYSVTGREYSPAWSPNGAWLTYVSYDLRARGIDSQSTAEPEIAAEAESDPDSLLREADVWVVAADASEKRRLTSFPIGSVRAPLWNPDGTHVAFVYSATPSNETLWVVENTEAPRALQVTYRFGLILGVRWPEADALWVSGRDMRDGFSQAVWRIPVLAGADEQMTLLFDPAETPFPDAPTPNTTGDQLAYRSAYTIVRRDRSSGSIQTYTEGVGNMPLYWSPASFSSEDQCAVNAL